MIILDTCAVLWLAAGSEKISSSVRNRIDKEPSVGVSAISAFEVALKNSQGKLILPLPPEQWWRGVIEKHNIELLKIDDESAFHAALLPPIHKDPADRFIIAAALIHRAAVVTADEIFSRYGVETVI